MHNIESNQNEDKVTNGFVGSLGSIARRTDGAKEGRNEQINDIHTKPTTSKCYRLEHLLYMDMLRVARIYSIA